MCENRKNCRQRAAEQLRRLPCPPVWVCQWEHPQRAVFWGCAYQKLQVSPRWDSRPFLGELLPAVRKCIFLASLFLLLILITLLTSLSSVHPLNHWFLVGSPRLLPECQRENCAVFFYFLTWPKKLKSSFIPTLVRNVSLWCKITWAPIEHVKSSVLHTLCSRRISWWETWTRVMLQTPAQGDLMTLGNLV